MTCTCRTQHLANLDEILDDAAAGDALALWWVTSVAAAQDAR